MTTEDQSSVIAFLSSPAAHAGAAVERIETHASMVFLAGERAWKLKRAVRYDYLDYSTADRRRAMCEAEVRINRRTAEPLYRGVTAVMRQADGSLTLGGAGTPVEWLVEMRRFDQACLLNQLAEAGLLPLNLMAPLAKVIARFHTSAESWIQRGGWDAMRRIIDGNAAGFAVNGAGILDRARCSQLTERARFVLDRGGDVLDQRRDDGWVRQCHGDLHLRNVVMLDGKPVLFDAIEFNDDISSIDVLYDLAFLLMDLGRLGLPHHANLLWNGYLAETDELSGLALMPLFLSCRAAVMAKTVATAANIATNGERRVELTTLANDYLDRARALLEPEPPRLIAVGGPSGSGKSTLALALAPAVGAAPGAVVLRSDEVRKKLCGVGPLDRLGPEGYTAAISQLVYATLMERANRLIRGGSTVIVDAVFAEPADRDTVQHVARVAGAPFTGLWLEAAEPVLLARIQARGPDASDADAGVVRRQLARRLTEPRWHQLDASRARQHVCDEACLIVRGVDDRAQRDAGTPPNTK